MSLLGWLWPPFKLPAPTGPHPIGTTWVVVRDPARAERFADAPGAVRECPMKLWYPAAVGATGSLGAYADPESMATLLPPALNQRLRQVRTHAVVDAPMAELRAPVLVFSHGYGGYAEQNTVQMEELASHGYVVASIAHPGEASWAPFPGGRGVGYAKSLIDGVQRHVRAQGGYRRLRKERQRVLRTLQAPEPADRLTNLRRYLALFAEPLRSQSVKEWALDTAVAVDHLTALDQGRIESPFTGRLDMARLGVFGMSYGGATAMEFCRCDTRCRAAVNIDGAAFGGLVDDELKVPLLILAAGPEGHATQRPVLDLVRGPAWLVTVPRTTHMGLTDLPLQTPAVLRWLGLTGRLSPVRRNAIMNDYIRHFFDQHLAGKPAAVFDGLAARYPEVAVCARNAA